MVRIVREPARLPCLESVAGTGKSWKDGSKEIRIQIMEALAKSQKQKCAYCEKRVRVNYHVEHFYEQSDCPERMFDWSNLFLSCGASRTCGKAKEKKKIECEKNKCKLDYPKIVNPEIDEPRQYFQFQLDGEIAPKEDINNIYCERAKYTIEVFQLNREGLKLQRKTYINVYLNELKEWEKCGEDLKLIWNLLIEDVTAHSEKHEFSAWILAFLLGGK